MNDEPTMGELYRRIEATDRRIAEVASRMVDGPVYAADKQRLYDKIQSVQGSLDALMQTVTSNTTRLASQRLVMLTGLVFPVLVAIITAVIFAALGGG